MPCASTLPRCPSGARGLMGSESSRSPPRSADRGRRPRPSATLTVGDTTPALPHPRRPQEADRGRPGGRRDQLPALRRRALPAAGGGPALRQGLGRHLPGELGGDRGRRAPHSLRRLPLHPRPRRHRGLRRPLLEQQPLRGPHRGAQGRAVHGREGGLPPHAGAGAAAPRAGAAHLPVLAQQSHGDADLGRAAARHHPGGGGREPRPRPAGEAARLPALRPGVRRAGLRRGAPRAPGGAGPRSRALRDLAGRRLQAVRGDGLARGLDAGAAARRRPHGRLPGARGGLGAAGRRVAVAGFSTTTPP